MGPSDPSAPRSRWSWGSYPWRSLDALEPLFPVDDTDNMRVVGGEHGRYYVLPLDSPDLTIVLGRLHGDDAFETTLDSAQATLDSLAIVLPTWRTRRRGDEPAFSGRWAGMGLSQSGTGACSPPINPFARVWRPS
jgi:hypothetical protein